tara:strand:+ start:377 stop:556 length:180 start_codon:yes stop_codon:yes gene_type:complete
MFIAEFLTLEKKANYVLRITFLEYLQGKVNPVSLIKDLGIKYNKDFTNEFYYKGVKIWI